MGTEFQSSTYHLFPIYTGFPAGGLFWLPPDCLLVLAEISSTLKMEAICSSETSVETQRTTRRHIPEDDILHNHRCENLKSYITSCRFKFSRYNFVCISHFSHICCMPRLAHPLTFVYPNNIRWILNLTYYGANSIFIYMLSNLLNTFFKFYYRIVYTTVARIISC
jgi:hypothetical protein